MKILSIGNSFSQDAQRWLHDIASSDDFELDTYNLFIGGCSLETHWHNIESNASAYSFEGNNGVFIKNISIEDALKENLYDIITIQQASADCGIPQSYFPYAQNIAEFVRKQQPKAKLYFHKTWSYDVGSTHGAFHKYNYDSKEMYRRLSDAAETVAKITDIGIIHSGDAIQKLRDTLPEFDMSNGGMSLCRDGFHLSLDYGRFTAATVWYNTLVGRKPKLDKFVAENPDFDPVLLNKILNIIDERQI